MKVIGFTKKFYTLWEVTSEHVDNQYESYDAVNHQYIKNISFDKETAMAKYPGAPVDLTLCGHSSWTSTKNYVKKQQYNDDCIQFGWCSGKKFEDATVEELSWYFERANEQQQDALLRVMEKHGYKKINHLVLGTPEMIAQLEKDYEQAEQLAFDIKNNNVVTFFCTRNLQIDNNIIMDHFSEAFQDNMICCGTLDVTDNDSYGKIVLIFPEVKEMSYQGYWYGLPLIDGKAKRIKGKTLSIKDAEVEIVKSEYGWGPTTYILVKDFSII